ncbi:MAG: hypothetical protein AABZ30_09665 [Myxococcota bacterium]
MRTPLLSRVLSLLGLATLCLPRCAEQQTFLGVLGRSMGVDTETGLPITPARADEHELGRVALDVGSAVTLLELAGEAGDPRTVDLRILEERSAASTDGDATIVRMLFPAADVRVAAQGSLRLGAGDGVPIDGVIGADLLSRFAISFDLARGRVTFLDEVPGTSSTLAQTDLLAVFAYRIRGGGNTSGSSCGENIPATRILLDACFEDLDADGASRKADFTATPSTAVAPIVVSRSSFARLRPSFTPAACNETLHLPSGSVGGACRTTVSAAALVSDTDASGVERGPCRSLARTSAGAGAPREAAAIACGDARAFGCEALADLAAESESESESESEAEAGTSPEVVVYVVPDEVFATLRIEVGAGAAALDAIVGTQFFALFRFWVDYPSSRVILDCRSEPRCAHRERLPPLQ